MEHGVFLAPDPVDVLSVAALERAEIERLVALRDTDCNRQTAAGGDVDDDLAQPALDIRIEDR